MVHDCDDLEEFLISLLLHRVCVSAVLDLAHVDLLIQAELTGEYEHSPVITANKTLLKKETGIG